MLKWLVVLLLVGGCEGSGAEAASGPSGEPEPAEQAITVVPRPPTPAELIEAAGDAADAFAVARPHLADEFGETSLGALLFANWSAAHLRWSDVDIDRDETSFGLVKKDADGERGKRMCWSGRIIQIERVDLLQGRHVYVGLLMTNRQDIIHFFAAGSTGRLVERSRARFCGYVTGRHSYANSGGGTSHAVQMVGMFKLPDNVAPQ